ncbi:MAG: motility protein A [Oscillospiraceae bacterium]|nr:motility protein A [Oscillospiraceae bacterium]MDD7429812.1 motility protein A [Oscillospiraceae bacterium]MDY2846651.1 motility protein A [Oscillospiraceae bacterium]
MNISLIVGWVIAIGLTIFGILSGGKLSDFWDPASVAIVVGGTIGAVIANYPLSTLKNVGKLMGIIFKAPKYDPEKYIADMVDYCKTARQKGILALEEQANACTDTFMKSALMLIVDANDSEKVKSMLDDSIDFLCERHEQNGAIFSRAAGVAPAFGMVGTLCGLIGMLGTLDPSDPESAAGLGPAMSTALVTTFYGSLLAHVLFTPLGNQLSYIHNSEVLCLQIIEEGTLAIISGANPRFVEEKLRMMLPLNAKPKEAKKSE